MDSDLMAVYLYQTPDDRAAQKGFVDATIEETGCSGALAKEAMWLIVNIGRAAAGRPRGDGFSAERVLRRWRRNGLLAGVPNG